MIQLNVTSASAMEALGQVLAEHYLTAGNKLFFQGELGAGKTTLIRGFLHRAGYIGTVKSPTYTLVEPYLVNGMEIFHFDLYRLKSAQELEAIGVRDYFSDTSICLVEWPEKVAKLIKFPDLLVNIQFLAKYRSVKLDGQTAAGREMLRTLARHVAFR